MDLLKRQIVRLEPKENLTASHFCLKMCK